MQDTITKLKNIEFDIMIGDVIIWIKRMFY